MHGAGEDVGEFPHAGAVPRRRHGQHGLGVEGAQKVGGVADGGEEIAHAQVLEFAEEGVAPVVEPPEQRDQARGAEFASGLSRGGEPPHLLPSLEVPLEETEHGQGVGDGRAHLEFAAPGQAEGERGDRRRPAGSSPGYAAHGPEGPERPAPEHVHAGIGDVSVAGEGRTPAAGESVLLQHGYLVSGVGHEGGESRTSRPRADHYDPARGGDHISAKAWEMRTLSPLTKEKKSSPRAAKSERSAVTRW